MLRLIALLITVLTGVWAGAQQASRSPLGVLITPPRQLRVPRALRSALPKQATVRLLRQTKMSSDGEAVVVYERGDEFEALTHVAVIKSGRRVADFRLTKLFEKEGIGETYALFGASEFLSAETRNVFLTAFRNIGDGSGTIFVLLAEHNGHYEVAWKVATVQGQFKVLPSGSMELWEADEGEECNWCPHRYRVTTFQWKAGVLSTTGRFTTKRKLDPEPISNRPIVVQLEQRRGSGE